MKKFLKVFLLILAIELSASYKYNGPYTRPPYNNREFLDSLRDSKCKVVEKAEDLTFAQHQMRKFINKPDDYNEAKK